jgi:hypothetical protein
MKERWLSVAEIAGFSSAGAFQSFPTMPEATASHLGEIGECLVDRPDLENNAAVQVYQLIGQLLEETEALREQWQTIAGRRPSIVPSARRKDKSPQSSSSSATQTTTKTFPQECSV